MVTDKQVEAAWAVLDDKYEVSSDGRVRQKNGKILKQWKNDAGYYLVRLSWPRRKELAHRLVAKCFIDNPENKPFVNHINNDRADNRVENLEWCTQRENLAHAEKQGRMKYDNWSGKRSPNAKLPDVAVAAIREKYSNGGVSWSALAKEHGVGKRTIGRILKEQSYV